MMNRGLAPPFADIFAKKVLAVGSVDDHAVEDYRRDDGRNEPSTMVIATIGVDMK